MTQQRRFTKEFEEEAVRLVQTSGRTQREIAGDLGIGLSTLVRWIGLTTFAIQTQSLSNEPAPIMSKVRDGQLLDSTPPEIKRRAGYGH